MGTRSLTVFQEQDGTEIAVLYRQFDGYPTGHGAELKAFLSDFSVQDGISGGTPERAANGMGCLAAQVVAHFKQGIGQFYLYPAGTRDAGEEYVYTVTYDRGHVGLKVQAGDVTLFGLPGTKQDNMPVIYDGPVDEFDPEATERLWREWPYDVPNDFLNSQSDEGSGDKE